MTQTLKLHMIKLILITHGIKIAAPELFKNMLSLDLDRTPEVFFHCCLYLDIFEGSFELEPFQERIVEIFCQVVAPVMDDKFLNRVEHFGL